jgi:hypothetical protein
MDGYMLRPYLPFGLLGAVIGMLASYNHSNFYWGYGGSFLPFFAYPHIYLPWTAFGALIGVLVVWSIQSLRG